MIEWGQWGQKSFDFIITPVQQDARINILEGSVRSSKTVTMIPKWLNYLVTGPPGLLIMTGVTKDTIYDNVLSDLFDVLGENNYKYNRQSGELICLGRRIKVLGAKDEGSEKYLRGKTIAGAYCDELSLMPESFFKQLLNRMSVKGAKLYGTTNPDSPYHYLYVEYITDAEKLAKGMVKVIHFELEDNPNLDDEYLDFIRNAYSGLWYDRMILGLWVLAEGAIYPMYDTNKHTITEADLPSFFNERWVSCDYGITNPHVYLDAFFLNIKGVEHLFITDEYYNAGTDERFKTDRNLVSAYFNFIGQNEIQPVMACITDPSAASFINEGLGQGMNIYQADNDVDAGLQLVSNWLEQGRIHIVAARCPNLCREFVSYIWDEKATLRGLTQPLKQHDHCMDALRYLLQTLRPDTGRMRSIKASKLGLRRYS